MHSHFRFRELWRSSTVISPAIKGPPSSGSCIWNRLPRERSSKHIRWCRKPALDFPWPSRMKEKRTYFQSKHIKRDYIQGMKEGKSNLPEAKAAARVIKSCCRCSRQGGRRWWCRRRRRCCSSYPRKLSQLRFISARMAISPEINWRP